ncbi:MAG: YfhO family protein [Candidatus Sumerlaeaceae bacterium]|nr:YfhO family protein [Candidatus Sumerlaeaceae bacterium]
MTPPVPLPVADFSGRDESAQDWDRRDWLVVALLGALVLIYFAPLTTGGRILSSVSGDVASEWLWKRGFLGETLAKGRIPFWNPHLMAGTPFLASGQSAIFYPPNLLFAFLPVGMVLNFQMIAHFWFGVAATYGLGRRLGRSRPAAFVAALVFGFSGFAVLHWWAGHLVFVLEWPWLPVMVWAWLNAVSSRRLVSGPALILAAALAMQFLAGHPQMVYMSLLVLAVLHCGWLFHFGTPDKVGMLRATASVGLALMLAGLLCGIQAYPTLLYSAETVRAGNAPMAYYEAGSQPVQDLITYGAPWAFGGRPGGQKYTGGESHWEVCGFVGVTTLLLALGALANWRSCPPYHRACLALCVLGGFLALGANSGLFPMLHRWFPGFGLFRNPGRFLFVAAFGWSQLASLGLDRLSWNSAEERKLVRKGLGIAAAAILAGTVGYLTIFWRGGESAVFRGMMLTRMPYVSPKDLTPEVLSALFRSFETAMLAAGASAVAGLGLMALAGSGMARRVAPVLLAGCVGVELLVFGWPYRTSFSPQSIKWPAEITTPLHNAGDSWRIGIEGLSVDQCQAMGTGVQSVWGNEPTASYRYGQAILRSQKVAFTLPPPSLSTATTSPLTQSLGMRFLLRRKRADAPTPAAGWSRIARKDTLSLYETTGAMPMYYVATEARVTTDPLTEVNALGFDPAREVLIEDVPPGMGSGNVTGLPAPHIKVIGSNRPESIIIQAEMPAAGWLVMMDQLLPGWTATVDGLPAKLYRANAVGRALPLLSGSHTVNLSYSAPGFSVGAVMTCIGGGLWLAGLLWTRRRRQKAPS